MGVDGVVGAAIGSKATDEEVLLAVRRTGMVTSPEASLSAKLKAEK
jgi:hypothetical protein